MKADRRANRDSALEVWSSIQRSLLDGESVDILIGAQMRRLARYLPKNVRNSRAFREWNRDTEADELMDSMRP